MVSACLKPICGVTPSLLSSGYLHISSIKILNEACGKGQEADSLDTDPERVEPSHTGSAKTWEKGPQSAEDEEDWGGIFWNIKTASGTVEARLAAF